MASRSHLGWPVPSSVWERHLEHVRSEWECTDLYAGVEAEQIVKLWKRIETTNAADLSRPTDPSPKTNEKKEQEPDTETRLADQEKEYVQVSFNDDVADTVRGYADQYDVNNGVMLAYILREYYDTDGWGYSREAVGSAPLSEQEDDETPEVPYGESEKEEWVTDRLRERIDARGQEQIHAEEIREVVKDARAASRFKHYRDAALDKLNYVHHPNVSGVYIPSRVRRDKFGIVETDPAIYRKPFDALTPKEKTEGIKAILSTRGVGMSKEQIHSEIFDGNGCSKHIKDLFKSVAQDEAATVNTTSGGTPILRVKPCGYEPEPEQRTEPDPEPEPEPEPEPIDESPEPEDESDERDDLMDEAAAEMDALDQAQREQQAWTDGGEDMTPSR